MPPQNKVRLDAQIVELGLAQSRERARALILAGRVLVSEQKQTKPGTAIAADAAIRILGYEMPYVSRGGLKLAGALDHWPIEVAGRSCADVGASTGGFTDCLLQRGAAHVTAVDTGFGQIAMKLRQDPRVKLMERTNARLLAPNALVIPEAELERSEGKLSQISLLVSDVSFISLTLILPAVFAAAPELSEAVLLVKPQFEAGREWVGRGGIVRDPEAHKLAVQRVVDCVRLLDWKIVEVIPSPITGAEGNHEFLLYARKP